MSRSGSIPSEFGEASAGRRQPFSAIRFTRAARRHKGERKPLLQLEARHVSFDEANAIGQFWVLA